MALSKMSPKTYNKIFIGVIFCLSILILILVLYYFREKQFLSTQILSNQQGTTKAYSTNTITQNAMMNPYAARKHDENVLYDQLYPPTNRTDASTYNNMDVQVRNRNMYVPTRASTDDYRMVGYLVSQEGNDSGGNNWKLFARQKNNNNADFYMVPANNNYDIKIPISNDIVVGKEKLRDVYTIPNEIQFNSPMLNKDSYTFIELPKTDLSDSRYL
jgi:hypothetical protein